MESTERFQDTSSIELGGFLSELADLLQVEKQLAARAEIHHQINVVGALERVVHFNEHGVIPQQREYVEFSARAVHVYFVLGTSGVLLFETLHREQLSLIVALEFPDEVNLTECSLTQQINEFKFRCQLSWLFTVVQAAIL